MSQAARERTSSSPSARAKRALRHCYAALPPPVRRLARAAFAQTPFPWNRGLTFARHYRHFSRSESLSRDELDALQSAELRRIVRHAATTVPAYRERFDKAGASWQDIRNRDDLAGLPLLDKRDLQDAPAAFVSSAVPPNQIVWRTTSGSTGTPLRVGVTRSTLAAEHALMVLGWQWGGYRPGDRVAVCVGKLTGQLQGPSFAPYTRTRTFLEVSPHHLDQRGCDAYLDMLQSFRPRFLRTYPSILLLLGNRLRERGMRIDGLAGLWTQSEQFDASQRDKIESAWGARIYDLFGMQEKCIYMSECEFGNLHVRSDFGVVELVPSNDSNLAQVVATGFFNPAMPLVRYRTRDLAEPAESPCPCGRPFPTVKRIVGRVEDSLYATDGREIFEIDSAIADFPRIRSCQIVQEELGRVRVLLVPTHDFGDADAGALCTSLRDALGDDMRIDIERLEAIPRTATGKQRFIVSRLDAQRAP